MSAETNPVFERRDWMADAACRGMDPNIFHPVRGENTGRLRAVCNDCPVIEPCRTLALADPSLYGFWGGTGQRERQRIRTLRAVS